jgi:CRISPR-associated Csx10 family RAMP protein
MQQGRIEFTDLVPNTSTEPTTRIGIGVNRKLNTVAEGRLFFYEATPAQANRFQGQIRGWATEQEIALLLGALKLITHFGGQKARGLGRAEVKPTALHIRRNGAWAAVERQPRCSPTCRRCADETDRRETDRALAHRRRRMDDLAQQCARELGLHPWRGVARRAGASRVRTCSAGTHPADAHSATTTPLWRDAFNACFGKDGARFGFLMPFGTLEWIPAPATALFNKQRDEYLYDTLFALLRGEDYPMECPNTGDRLERGRGWLEHKGDQWRKAKMPQPRAFVRVGLNRKLEAAEGGVLYTLEAIDPTDADGNPVEFRGVVSFPDAASESAFRTILDALRWRDECVHLRIGSARTRGFGAVALETVDAPAPAPQVDLKAFAQRAGKPIFTLLARTPVLVHEPCGAPAPTLTPDLLREYLPDLPDSVQLLPEATRVERMLVSGWSGAWGMPKPVQQAFAPGSVFTYEYAPSDAAALQNWLQQLALHGVGERVAEGYGQFAVCSRYHMDTDITPFTQSNAGGAQ